MGIPNSFAKICEDYSDLNVRPGKSVQYNVPRILNLPFSNVPQTITAYYVIIHCLTDSQNTNSSKNISAERVLLRNNILLASHEQITKYDSLKFFLKVRVKNSKCSSILLLRQMFLRIQNPEIPLFSMSAQHIN